MTSPRDFRAALLGREVTKPLLIGRFDHFVTSSEWNVNNAKSTSQERLGNRSPHTAVPYNLRNNDVVTGFRGFRVQFGINVNEHE